MRLVEDQLSRLTALKSEAEARMRQAQQEGEDEDEDDGDDEETDEEEGSVEEESWDEDSDEWDDDDVQEFDLDRDAARRRRGSQELPFPRFWCVACWGRAVGFVVRCWSASPDPFARSWARRRFHNGIPGDPGHFIEGCITLGPCVVVSRPF